MWPITVTIIARDEEDWITDAIRSVAFADEVLVLDSGSTDGTVAVARALGARVIETDWPGHVAQKNRALEAASHDWVLSIDADEQVGGALAASIAQLRSAPPDHSGYRMSRLNWWMGRPLRHGTWYPDSRVRLFDRRRARWVGEDPHDLISLEGSEGRLAGDLVHHPYRNFAEHLQTIGRYSELAAASALAAGRRAHWWDVAFRPPLHIAKALLLRMGFLDGVRGLCVAWLGAAYVASKWGRMWWAQVHGRGGKP